MDNRNSNKEEYIDLFAYCKAMLQRKKLIGVITLSACVLSVVLSLILPKVYAAKASILPPQQDSSITSVLQSSSLGSLAGGLLGSKSQSDLWVGILKSQTVMDAVIERFNLRELYSTKTIEDTRKKLLKNVIIEKTQEEIISVTVEDKDPKRAADMANAFVDELDKVNGGSVTTSGQRMRVFVEKRLKDAKANLATIEDQIKSFQEKYGAVKIDDQSKVVMEAMGEIKGQIMAKEVQFQTLLSFAAQSNPQVQLLKTELVEFRARLSELENGTASNGIFLPTSKIPEISVNYVRLLRDAKVQETLFELLTQQYEFARMQEASDSSTVQFLDSAKPPEKRSKPKRSLIVLAGIFLGFFGSAGYVFFKDFLRPGRER